LAYLLKERGRVIGKKEMIDHVWSDTAVVDDVLVQSIKDIRRALGDDARHPRYIKTFPKTGYRFLGNIDEIIAADAVAIDTHQGVDLVQPRTIPSNGLREAPIGRRVWFGIAITILAISLALGFASRIFWSPVRLSKVPGQKVVVVMLFENQSKDPDLDWLRESLTEMLIARLSRSPNLAVLPRVELYRLLKQADLNPRSIGLTEAFGIMRSAGGEALITGSFSGLGEKVRIDIQVYSATSFEMIAAETITVEKADHIPTEIDQLSLKLIDKLGETDNGFSE
jgi:TolB-like protein